jgi:glycosyltransferase involved in cell wall biosynthesis
MHIAVDGSSWGGQERGVAVAARRLWSAFLKYEPPRQATVFASESHRSQMPRATVFPVGPLSGARKIAWQQCVLPGLVRKQDVDILHCPCYTAPVAAACRLVITVHDLIAWTNPALAGWKNALHLRLLVGHGVRRANAVCVPTDFVRRCVIEQFAIPARKVFVVPWGVDADISPLASDQAADQVWRRFGIDEPYILFCGCIEAKKNLQTAVQASAEAGILLLIAGPWISGSRSVLSEKSCGGGRWSYLGYVSPSDLGALYSAAVALVAPSYVEGFGLSAVEAMRCGCPVVASDCPALREVCGRAAIHVPYHHIPGFASSLRALAGDRVLRDDLIARGTARAAFFNWAAASARFAEAIHYAEVP